MIERYPVPDEAVTLAWEAAHRANEAHDRLNASIGQLSLMQECAKLNLNGVEISDDALEDRRSEAASATRSFDLFAAMASPVMLDPASPFRSLASQEGALVKAEQAENHEILEAKLLHTEDDLRKFGIAHGYHKSVGSRVWTALTRSPQETNDAVIHVVTPSFDTHEAMDSDTLVTQYEDKIAIVMTAEAEEDRFSARIHGNDIYRLDIRSVYNAIQTWGDEIPQIRDFGPGTINFLADYANHMIPDLEVPLRTNYTKVYSAAAKRFVTR